MIIQFPQFAAIDNHSVTNSLTNHSDGYKAINMYQRVGKYCKNNIKYIKTYI